MAAGSPVSAMKAVGNRHSVCLREDYSPGGTASEYFPHEIAHSRAYRWGEDGLAGFADDKLLCCLGLALDRGGRG